MGSGYVGWCPLGYRDRPVYAWGGGYNRGYAVPRHGGYGGWNVVREGDFGQRDVARRRMPLAGIDPGALQVADSPNLRPTRNARSLVASNATARAISRRPTPGDFVRELAVDNKTTIPSPWLRRGQARADDVRDREARNQTDQASAARPRRGTGDSAAAARTSVPWYAPRSEAAAPRAGGTAAQGRESSQRDTQAYSRSGEASRSTARPEGTSRPRAERSVAPVREPSQRQPSEGSVRQRQDADRGGESLGGQARSRSSSPRRDDSSASRPQAQREERPARDTARSEPRAQPRMESSSGSSRGDSSGRSGGGQHSSGGQHSGGGQRSAPRPSRDRH